MGFDDMRPELKYGSFFMAALSSEPGDYFSFTIVRFEPAEGSENRYLIEASFEGELFSKDKKKHIVVENGAFLTSFVPPFR